MLDLYLQFLIQTFPHGIKKEKSELQLKKLRRLVRNAIVQTERGTFAYVQVLFSNTADHLKIESRGMTMASLVTKMNDGMTNGIQIHKQDVILMQEILVQLMMIIIGTLIIKYK